jgi:hypothetical protein
MRFVTALAVALVVLGCRSGGTRPGTLSFAQMQSINPGVSADWLLQEYPFGRVARRHPGGAVAQLGYQVTDPQNKGRSLTLFFDEAGILARKSYAGPFVRPPIETNAQGSPANR